MRFFKNKKLSKSTVESNPHDDIVDDFDQMLVVIVERLIFE